MEGWSSRSRHRIGQNLEEIKSVISIRNLKLGHEKVENALVFIVFSECCREDLGMAKGQIFLGRGWEQPQVGILTHKEVIRGERRTNWAIQT